MFLATLLLLSPGCRVVAPQSPPQTASAARPLIEFQSPCYDGSTLSGRILVSAAEGAITVDRRLLENSSLEVTAVLDCATTQPVEFLVADRFPAPARAEDLLSLEPGYWFGADVEFPLFDEQLNGKRGPDCIDLTLTFHPKHPTSPVTTTLRVTRPMEQPDAG
ncbi:MULTISPECIES: hypothetical protein [unclassified Corallococcus]|uniref:hypothetical protein n=1 Tax=unclassified Corallococcus TaxID=2685029 RepID=UPI001A90C201|nr:MULTISPECIES: hypothetical protein [unclassified Corallococcus]MBN9685104.1 hypothetical protein [Corallococcus sp. NCSPR001]WAS83437.1 hypothetical protein O0N60_29495 [Corallococcus sp. NCRR]